MGRKKTIQPTPAPSFPFFSDNTGKVPLLKITLQPFNLFFDNIKMLLKVSWVYLLALLICSMGLGRGISCSVEQAVDIRSAVYCSENVYVFFTDLILRSLILFLFCIKWYQIGLQKTPYSIKQLFVFNSCNAIAIGFMVLFIIINMSPVLGMGLLYARQVTPDWKLELVYFTSVAWIFLLPLLVIRFYSVIAFALSCEKIPSLSTIWNKTKNNMLRLLISFCLLIFLALFLFLQYYGQLMSYTENTYYTAFSAEIIYDILVLFFSSLFINYCYTQKELFFGENNNGR